MREQWVNKLNKLPNQPKFIIGRKAIVQISLEKCMHNYIYILIKSVNDVKIFDQTHFH